MGGQIPFSECEGMVGNAGKDQVNPTQADKSFWGNQTQVDQVGLIV